MTQRSTRILLEASPSVKPAAHFVGRRLQIPREGPRLRLTVGLWGRAQEPMGQVQGQQPGHHGLGALMDVDALGLQAIPSSTGFQISQRASPIVPSRGTSSYATFQHLRPGPISTGLPDPGRRLRHGGPINELLGKARPLPFPRGPAPRWRGGSSNHADSGSAYQLLRPSRPRATAR